MAAVPTPTRDQLGCRHEEGSYGIDALPRAPPQIASASNVLTLAARLQPLFVPSSTVRWAEKRRTKTDAAAFYFRRSFQ